MSINIKDLSVDALEFQMFVLDELADELIAKGEDVIKITIGISELEVPENIKQVFRRTIDDFERTHVVYPEGLPELRAAVAEFYNRKYGTAVDGKNVIINTGTSPIFRNLFQLVTKPGQEILIPRPYYCLYYICGLLADATVKFYDIDHKTGRVDMDSFWREYDADRTSAVVINNPGNPVGNVLTKDEILKIYDMVDGNSFIVNDEIYNNTCFYTNFECPLAYVPEQYRDTTVVTNGFSKGYRMYTKRVGFALLPEALVMPMRIVQQHTLLTHDPVAQYAMIEALKDEASPQELSDTYKGRAEYTFEQLQGTGCTPLKVEGGFYAVLDCEQWIQTHGFGSSKELARDILEKVHVACVPGTDFGIPNGLRLSFCESRYHEAIDRLRAYFTNQSAQKASATHERVHSQRSS